MEPINFIRWEEKDEKAFNALLAYEKNCIAKYDRVNLPSLPPKKGERISDFAQIYGTTIDQMKRHWRTVEYVLSNSK